MPTLYEQYEGYHYPMDKDMEEDLKIRKEEEAGLLRDLEVVEAWHREQAEKEKAGGAPEAEPEGLSPEEEAARKEKQEWLEEHKNMRRETRGIRNGWIDGDGKFTPFPIQESRIAYTMRTAMMEMIHWGDPFPDDPDIGEKFPAVDPRGCYSEVDMGFKDRCEKIRAAQAVRPEVVRAYTDQLLENLEKQETGVGKLWKFVADDAEKLRCTTRAAKRAVTADDSEWLQEACRERREKSMNFAMFDKVLGVVEYAAGLTEKVPGPEERKLAESLGMPLTREVEAQRHAVAKMPETIHVDFADFSSKMEQKYFCNPKLWGRSSRRAPKDAPSAEVAEASMEKYAAATADRQLSPLFAQAESLPGKFLTRGDLIIVGGRTVREIMQERFQQGIKEGTIEKGTDQLSWYRENQARMAGEIVSAGLMAGKRVEAFVPDKNGRIPKEPVSITKTGYEPSPLEKVTLNAWERHFARHGYYKEKAAKAVDYKQTMEARERVRAMHEANMTAGAPTHLKHLIFEDWVRENGPLPESVPGGFSATRGVFPSMAVCVMLNQGHSLEDIVNPDKLTDVRNAAAKEVIEKMTAGDKEWEAETFFHGGNKLVSEMERVAREVDITNEKELYSEKGRVLFSMTCVLQDVQQDMRKQFIDQELNDAAEKAYHGMGEKKLEELDAAAKGLTFYLDVAADNAKGRRNFLEMGIDGAMTKMAAWEILREVAAERKSADPGKSPLELVSPQERVKAQVSLSQNPQLREFGEKAEERIREKPEYAVALAKKALSGELGRAMQVKVDLSVSDPRLLKAEVSINAKQSSRRERKEEKLREVVDENLARDARKERDKERKAAQEKAQKAAPKSAPSQKTGKKR